MIADGYQDAKTLQNRIDWNEIYMQAPYILDATELGDLLELADVEDVIGAAIGGLENAACAGLPGLGCGQ